MSTKASRLSYWSNVNTAWGSSGLTQKKFCEQEGLLYKQFVYWRSRLCNKEKPNRSESKPQLLKVSIAPDPKAPPMIVDTSSSLEVLMPMGIKIFIKAESDISKAARLIRVLGEAL